MNNGLQIDAGTLIKHWGHLIKTRPSIYLNQAFTQDLEFNQENLTPILVRYYITREACKKAHSVSYLRKYLGGGDVICKPGSVQRRTKWGKEK